MKQQLRHGLPRLGGGGERLQLDIGQHFIAVARGCQFRKLRQAAPFCSPKRFSDGICLSSCEPPKTVHTAQSHLVQYSLLNARNAPIQHTSVPLGFYNLRSSVAPPQQRHSGRSELVIINALVLIEFGANIRDCQQTGSNPGAALRPLPCRGSTLATNQARQTLLWEASSFAWIAAWPNAGTQEHFTTARERYCRLTDSQSTGPTST